MYGKKKLLLIIPVVLVILCLVGIVILNSGSTQVEESETIAISFQDTANTVPETSPQETVEIEAETVPEMKVEISISSTEASKQAPDSSIIMGKEEESVEIQSETVAETEEKTEPVKKTIRGDEVIKTKSGFPAYFGSDSERNAFRMKLFWIILLVLVLISAIKYAVKNHKEMEKSAKHKSRNLFRKVFCKGIEFDDSEEYGKDTDYSDETTNVIYESEEKRKEKK